jgi:threonine dehydrogenase-like Zn-dependent dehydrogenase
MRAGQITALGRIELVDAGRQRALADGEVIVAPETGCLCGSDIPYFNEAQERYPLDVGLSLHEIVGRVIDSSSPMFQAGDRVLAMPLGLRGLSALSTLPGLIGSTVAVVGQGPIGLLFNGCLSSLGAARIIGIDVLEPRAARGREFGATDSIAARRTDPIEAVRELTGGIMADLVVEAVGHQEQAFNLCIELCCDSGRLLYFGVPPERIHDVAWHTAFRKSLTVHTSVPADLRPFVTIAMRAIREGRIDPLPLITHRYPFADVQRAFEAYRDRRDGALKVMIDFVRD